MCKEGIVVYENPSSLVWFQCLPIGHCSTTLRSIFNFINCHYQKLATFTALFLLFIFKDTRGMFLNIWILRRKYCTMLLLFYSYLKICLNCRKHLRTESGVGWMLETEVPWCSGELDLLQNIGWNSDRHGAIILFWGIWCYSHSLLLAKYFHICQ